MGRPNPLKTDDVNKLKQNTAQPLHISRDMLYIWPWLTTKKYNMHSLLPSYFYITCPGVTLIVRIPVYENIIDYEHSL